MSSANVSNLESYLDGEDRDGKKVQTSAFIKVLKLSLRHKALSYSGLSMILLSTFAALLEPRIFGYAIDEAILPRRWDHLRVIGFILILTLSLRIIATIQQSYFFESLGQKVTQDLRLQLFSHLERLSIQTHSKHPPGRLLTRVTNDIAALNEMFSAGLVSMFCNILLVIGILIWLLILDFKLGLIALSVFPILLTLSVYFSGRLRKAYRDSRSRLSALNSFLAENLSGMKIVHLFNRQEVQTDRYNRLNHWYGEAQISSIRVYALFQPSITISAGISIALIIWFGGQATLNGQMKLGILVAYFSYLLSLFQPVREIADKWNVFLSGMTSAERVFSILEWPAELEANHVEGPHGLIAAEAIQELKGEIIFENVWFAYFGEKWVIKDLCLTIRAGEKIGIVGHTGSGKSTLIQLLLRFYHPQRGRILLDGKNIQDYDLRSLRASLGMVQQDVFLFSGTFEDNITFWNKKDHYDVNATLKKFGIETQSYSTLSEKGANFSMGERQVIAFARAYMSHPKIWILDEATANMDSESERLIQEGVAQASAGKTTLVVAHRLATIKASNRILVLHQGRLVESGSHSELMDEDGYYSKLYRLQKLEA